MAQASTAARRRLLPLGAGAAALALLLSGCIADQEEPNGSASSTGGSSNSTPFSPNPVSPVSVSASVSLASSPSVFPGLPIA